VKDRRLQELPRGCSEATTPGSRQFWTAKGSKHLVDYITPLYMSIINTIAVFALQVAVVVVVGFVMAEVAEKLLYINTLGGLTTKLDFVARPALWIGCLGVAVLGLKFLIPVLVYLFFLILRKAL